MGAPIASKLNWLQHNLPDGLGHFCVVLSQRASTAPQEGPSARQWQQVSRAVYRRPPARLATPVKNKVCVGKTSSSSSDAARLPRRGGGALGDRTAGIRALSRVLQSARSPSLRRGGPAWVGLEAEARHKIRVSQRQ